MKQTRFTLLKVFIALFVFAVGVIAVVAGAKVAHRVREQRLHALFVGPCEVVAKVTDWTYYPRCVYDLQAYESYGRETFSSEAEAAMPFPAESEPRDLEWVEGAAREQLEAMIRERRTADAVTGATAVFRLRSPTVYRARRPSRLLRISYPPDGAVFPPNLCEPCVEWEDGVNTLWQVTVEISGTSLQWRFVTTERRWWFPPEVWRVLQEKAVEHDAYIQVKGVRRCADSAIQASQRVCFHISRWLADEAIVYRLVAPPFIKYKTPDTFVRDLRSFRTRPFLLGRRKYCFNCHTFSSKRGTPGKVGLQVRYMAGGHALPVYFGVYDIEEQRGWKVRLPFDIQMTTFMTWAPDEQKLAFSANQQIVAFSPIICETQFAGEPTSDIAIYDMSQKTAYLLPGASDPDLLEIYPHWSPGGESIVYCAAPPGVHPEQVHYNLRVISFNEGRGGVSRAVSGASQNGRSNYYPRYSPDGKWLSFCQSSGGDLIRSSSDMYLLSGGLEGPAHRLECNVDYAADSWHSWSSNSHWLVFATKRDDGIYARLYLTQIDDEGHASPAVRLPVKNLPLESFNIPEFVAQAPQIGERKLFEAIRVEKPAISVQGGASQ
jgi:hypothetical protein